MTDAIARSYEEIIGTEPWTNKSEGPLMADFIGNTAKQNAVRSWVQLKGITAKSAMGATPASLAKAYLHKAYLRKWRSNVNPGWDLINSDDEDGGDVSSSMAQTTQAATTVATKTEDASINKDAMAAWLKDLYVQIEKAVNLQVNEKLAKTTIQLDATVKDQIKTLARDAATLAAAEECDRRIPPQEIAVVNHITGTSINLGLQHEKFPLLLRAAQARDHKSNRLNVWLTGPTGSGKTTAAENVAKALDLPFGSDGSLDADYKVMGFRDANGNIISTEFLRIYEGGGIYVADEIDNWMPSALLSLNAALANGWCSTPKGMVHRHPDCLVIACANTWGHGATNDYVGRTKLDAASLDRFQPKIDWPYDEKLEYAIAERMGGLDGLDWFETVSSARKQAKANGLKVILSPRATYNGISLLQAGFTKGEVVDMTIGAGISPEQRRQLAIRV
jgi:hypothetical protein